MSRCGRKWFFVIMEGPANERRLHLQFRSSAKNNQFDFAKFMLHQTHKYVGEQDLDTKAGFDKPGYYRLTGFVNHTGLKEYYPPSFAEIVIGADKFFLKPAD